jgi:hypothetical protein
VFLRQAVEMIADFVVEMRIVSMVVEQRATP